MLFWEQRVKIEETKQVIIIAKKVDKKVKSFKYIFTFVVVVVLWSLVYTVQRSSWG